MDIRIHLHQTAEYRAATRDHSGNPIMDERGQLKYDRQKEIPCRKRYKITETLTASAQLIRGEWIYRLNMPVRADDMLDNRRVLFVQEMISPGGDVYGYKAVC